MSKSKEEQHFFDAIWKFWTPEGAEVPPCILDTCFAEAVTLHEITPRSTNPLWLEQPFNSVPVCGLCHETVQLSPTTSAAALHKMAIERAHAIADWKGVDYDRVLRTIYNPDEGDV